METEICTPVVLLQSGEKPGLLLLQRENNIAGFIAPFIHSYMHALFLKQIIHL